jgi:hypothetical protein
MKKIILVVIGLSMVYAVNAQDFLDNALLFSRPSISGSARMQGLGGTHVSLGGDYSAAYSNPAGLGMFNKSEFTFTPSIYTSKSSSQYFGTKTNDSKTSFNIPGLSFVFHWPNERENSVGFLGGTLGVSLTRTNNFNENYQITGVNNQNSIVNYFLDDANGVYFNNQKYDPANLAAGGDDFYNLTALAFNNFLIDTLRDGNGDIYYDSPLTFLAGDNGSSHVRQTEISKKSGAQYQWSFAYGANFSDKLFLGATVGLSNIRYKVKQTYVESDYAFAPRNFPTANPTTTIDETFNITASGANLTLGLIYKPVDFIQVGASYVTPTYYQFSDIYDAKIATNWHNYEYYPPEKLNTVNERFDEPLVSQYALRTPMHFNAGVTFISKFGFITGDLEFVNYSKAKYSDPTTQGGFSSENRNIKSGYQSVLNYKLGAEGRYKKFRARAGANYMSNPYLNRTSKSSTISFTGGLGYRNNDFFIDLAAVFSNANGTRSPYSSSIGNRPVADQKFSTVNYVATVGFNF